MAHVRNIAAIVMIMLSFGVYRTSTALFGPEDNTIFLSAAPRLKQFTITYRIDDGNKRGKEQKTVVTASSSSEAKENFRTENPTAVIISCTEKPD